MDLLSLTRATEQRRHGRLRGRRKHPHDEQYYYHQHSQQNFTTMQSSSSSFSSSRCCNKGASSSSSAPRVCSFSKAFRTTTRTTPSLLRANPFEKSPIVLSEDSTERTVLDVLERTRESLLEDEEVSKQNALANYGNMLRLPGGPKILSEIPPVSYTHLTLPTNREV